MFFRALSNHLRRTDQIERVGRRLAFMVTMLPLTSFTVLSVLFHPWKRNYPADKPGETENITNNQRKVSP